jgi:hypothetical protein
MFCFLCLAFSLPYQQSNHGCARESTLARSEFIQRATFFF